MKNRIYNLLIFFLFCFSCSTKEGQKITQQNNRIQNDNNIEKNEKKNKGTDLLEYALTYMPVSFGLDSDINNDLEHFDLLKIFSNTSADTLQLISEIIILRHYVYELHTAFQSFNLFNSRNGNAKLIIDYALLANQIDTLRDLYTAANITEIKSKEKNLNPILKEILNDIKKEEDEIDKMYKEIGY